MTLCLSNYGDKCCKLYVLMFGLWLFSRFTPPLRLRHQSQPIFHARTQPNKIHSPTQIEIQTNINFPQLLQIQLLSTNQWNRLPSKVFAHNSLDAFKGALQDINLTTAPSRTSNKK